MDKKKLMLMLGAVVLAIVLALAARTMLSGNSTPQVQAAVQPIVAPKGPRVLVAQRVLPPGTIITADAVSYQDWPANMVNPAFFVEGKVDQNKLIGTVVRYPITAGQPITQGALVSPGDRGFLAAALGPGMRAITVTVTDKSGVAGFVFPGDRVDLMLTTDVKVHNNNANGTLGDDRDLYATETILRNLRVLATDQSPTSEQTPEGKTVVHTFHTVTLEVTPKIAEKIEVAQAGGQLSLTLRSIADNQTDLDRAIASGQVQLDPKTGQPSAASAKAFGGPHRMPETGPSTFTTAGDISRFQRKTLPPAGISGAKQIVNALVDRLGAPRANPLSGVHVTRGRDTQQVTIGANGMPAAAAPGAAPATGMTNQFATGAGQAGAPVAAAMVP